MALLRLLFRTQGHHPRLFSLPSQLPNGYSPTDMEYLSRPLSESVLSQKHGIRFHIPQRSLLSLSKAAGGDRDSPTLYGIGLPCHNRSVPVPCSPPDLQPHRYYLPRRLPVFDRLRNICSEGRTHIQYAHLSRQRALREQLFRSRKRLRA